MRRDSAEPARRAEVLRRPGLRARRAHPFGRRASPARRRRAAGFTLLEVMMATAVLAVGTVSVLMVFATALSFAHRRQGQQQLAQVIEEAHTDARARVNRFRPGKTPAATKSATGSKGAKGSTPSADTATPAGTTADTDPQASAVFSAYTYTLHFEPIERGVPEAGWQTTVTVNWGDGQSYQETLPFLSDVIPDEEFASSESYLEERAGTDKGTGTRETR